MVSGTRRRSEHPRPALSREVIARAALGLAARQPATPLTLSRLGAELGADPTALYRHFRNREELLLYLADMVYGQLLAEWQPQGDWRATLSDAAYGMRRALLRTPALAAELGPRFTGGPNEAEVVRRLHAALRAAGFEDDELVAHTRSFGGMVLSHAVMTAAVSLLPPEASTVDLDVIARLEGPGAPVDVVDYEHTSFALILEVYLDGLAARSAGGQP